MILLQTLAVPQFEWNKKHVVRHVRVPAGGHLMRRTAVRLPPSGCAVVYHLPRAPLCSFRRASACTGHRRTGRLYECCREHGAAAHCLRILRHTCYRGLGPQERQ